MNRRKEIVSAVNVISIILFLILESCAGSGTRKIVLIETTDVHGMLLPFDYIEGRERNASLASAAGYLASPVIDRKTLVLLDNGDNLQGQPTEYYYNFIDTVSPHFNSLVMNWLGYDAGTVGNHDIEAGHSVYDRVRKQYDFPLLAANAVDVRTGKPYFEPYAIIKRNGLKVAVLGLVTPSVPNWLPPELYSGMEFRDMAETAREWMPLIRKEEPDIVVGLFHSGWDKDYMTQNDSDYSYENGSASVAFNVHGFDVIFNGHDHSTVNEKIINSAGDTVLILDGGSRAEKIARADITVYGKKINGKRKVRAEGSVIELKDYKPDEEYLSRFAGNDIIIRNYVEEVIGESSSDISSRQSYFGSSAYTDMIHSLQLEISGADISFAAPLSFDTEIKKGPVTVGDMFKLYRFENMLYTMTLSGREILKYLEFSYSGWFSTMKDQDDHLLNFRTGPDGKPLLSGGRARLKNQPYNFDSAAGIDYIVDVSKPAGQRIKISSLSDGRPFSKDSVYKVAVSSYRGSGGGGHFSEGAGIGRDELRNRLITSTGRDLRSYIIRSVESKRKFEPMQLNNWKVIPEKWVENAVGRDYRLLFGNDQWKQK